MEQRGPVEIDLDRRAELARAWAADLHHRATALVAQSVAERRRTASVRIRMQRVENDSPARARDSEAGG
jgi:hypothetical protein